MRRCSKMRRQRTASGDPTIHSANKRERITHCEPERMGDRDASCFASMADTSPNSVRLTVGLGDQLTRPLRPKRTTASEPTRNPARLSARTSSAPSPPRTTNPSPSHSTTAWPLAKARDVSRISSARTEWLLRQTVALLLGGGRRLDLAVAGIGGAGAIACGRLTMDRQAAAPTWRPRRPDRRRR